MSVNILPKGFRQKLYELFGKFLWGGSKDKKKMHLVNWEVVFAPVNMGGSGILNLGNMNEALAVKWIYKFANCKEAL